jgi:hypothetical protein
MLGNQVQYHDPLRCRQQLASTPCSTPVNPIQLLGYTLPNFPGEIGILGIQKYFPFKDMSIENGWKLRLERMSEVERLRGLERFLRCGANASETSRLPRLASAKSEYTHNEGTKFQIPVPNLET